MMHLQATARKLMSWSSRVIGNMRHNQALSRAMLLPFDKAREDGKLTNDEEWLRKQIKLS
jgi:hypothetical protein